MFSTFFELSCSSLGPGLQVENKYSLATVVFLQTIQQLCYTAALWKTGFH